MVESFTEPSGLVVIGEVPVPLAAPPGELPELAEVPLLELEAEVEAETRVEVVPQAGAVEVAAPGPPVVAVPLVAPVPQLVVVPPAVDDPPEGLVVPAVAVTVLPDEVTLGPELLITGAVTVIGPTCAEVSWLPEPSLTLIEMPYDDEGADGDHCSCNGRLEFGATCTLACWASVAPSLPPACTTSPYASTEPGLCRFTLMVAGVPTCGLTGWIETS